MTATEGSRRPHGADRSDCPADSHRAAVPGCEWHLHRALYRSERSGSRPRRSSSPRSALLLVRLQQMRIAFDVSPLSHEPTGIGNYIRGSLTRPREVARPRGHEIVAFAPTSAGRTAHDRGGARGSRYGAKLVSLPVAHDWRPAWCRAGYPSAERFIGRSTSSTTPTGCSRRSGRLRSTMIHDLVPLHHREWVTPRTYSMHSAKYRDAPNCDTVFVNSEYTRDDVVRDTWLPARVHVAPPGSGLTSGPTVSAPTSALPTC